MNQWWQPSKPGQIKPVPWLSPEATQYLESIIKPEFEVCEHGSGGSTLWMAERCKKVSAFENDPDWCAIVRAHAPLNAAVWTKPIFGDTPVYDLLLIDGEPVKDRGAWITASPQMVKPGGWIVLDNAPRPEYAKERAELHKFADLIATFSATGVSHKYLVTEFWKVKGGE